MRINCFSIKIAAAILIFAPFFYTYAQLQQEGAFWVTESVIGDFRNKKFKYLFNHELRFRLDQDIKEAIFRGLTGYELSKKLTFWIGYRWATTGIGCIEELENRSYEDIIVTLIRDKRLTLGMRTRFEQRKKSIDPQWEYRFREKAFLILPKLFKSKTNFIVSEEIFLNMNQTTDTNGRTFEQNRVSLSLDSQISKHAFFEIGYLNQYKSTNPVRELTHVFFIELSVDF